MRQVVEAAAFVLRILPVFAEESFLVPQDWHAEFQILSFQSEVNFSGVGDLAFVMEAIFKTIAVGVIPQESD